MNTNPAPQPATARAQQYENETRLTRRSGAFIACQRIVGYFGTVTQADVDQVVNAYGLSYDDCRSLACYLTELFVTAVPA